MGLIRYIKKEMQTIRERSSHKSPLEVIVYPSFKAILRYRIAHKLYKRRFIFGQMVFIKNGKKTGIEIHQK